MIKICQACGKPFDARTKNQKYCKGPHYTKCVICGKEFEYTCSPTSKPHTCSMQCRIEYKKLLLSEKYGKGITNVSQIPEVREKKKISNASESALSKMRETNMKKYGVEHVMDDPEIKAKFLNSISSEESKEKRKKTFKEHYGTDHVFSNKEFRKEHGCNTVSTNPEVKKKIHDTFQEKYGVDCASQVPEFVDKAKETRTKTMQDRYGCNTIFETDQFKNKMKDIYGVENVSKSEEIQKEKIENSLKKYGTEYPQQSKSVKIKISNSVKSEECQNKIKNTSIKHHGTEYPMQSNLKK